MYETVLNHLRRWIDLTPDEEEYFVSLLTERKYRKGQLLLREGEICKNDTYIIKGILRLHYPDDMGKEHIIMFCREDEWISDFESYILQKPASMNISALEDSEVLLLERRYLDNLFQKVPKFESLIRKKMQMCFAMFQERVIDTLSVNSKERYLKFLEKYSDIEQRIPQHYIAAYLGITPQFMSQIRAELRTTSKTISHEENK
jgi:CRP-like cAMP-binding protein